LVREKASWARADLDTVLVPDPERIDPPCSHFSACGGCQWQYMTHREQLSWKSSIVAGQLEHLGGLTGFELREIVAPGAPYCYRNRMTFHVVDGRPGLYRHRSREQVPIASCSLLHPDLQAVYQQLGPLPGASDVTLRMGVETGDRMVLIRGPVPDHARHWGGSVVRLAGRRFEPVIGPPHIHEDVAGLRFRITGPVFFQVNTAGAEALVELVMEALRPEPDDVILDAFAGVGLFSAILGRSGARVIAVESNGIAAGDLRHNLGVAGVSNGEVHRARFEEAASLGNWDLAVCDPPRRGLGETGVASLASGHPRRIAYVSCDPASLARDAGLLEVAGYRLAWLTPVDLFPQTFHVETVAVFDRD
jgi:23S rRNA (uracil1939-C5)-methyltransferase